MRNMEYFTKTSQYVLHADSKKYVDDDTIMSIVIDDITYTLISSYYIVGVNDPFDSCADVENKVINCSIQRQINGLPVRKIGHSAFRFHKALQSVYIPNTINELGYDCFGYIPTLIDVQFEENFDHPLTFSQGVFVNATNLKTIQIPATSILNLMYVFYHTNLDMLLFCGIDDINKYSFINAPKNILLNRYYKGNTFGGLSTISKVLACDTHVYKSKNNIFCIYRSNLIFSYIYVYILL